MRIGELSKRTGLSRDTIRFYERRGLIASEPEPGQTNRYRSYPEETVLTLELIGEAQDAGMTLADLTVFIAQLGADDSVDGEAFLDARIAEVEARIARSKRFMKTLRATRAALGRAAR